MKRSFQRKFFKETTENWHGNYDVNDPRVKGLVSVLYSKHPDGVFTIIISGNDDTFMCIQPSSLHQSRIIINKIIAVKYITYKFLEELMFES